MIELRGIIKVRGKKGERTRIVYRDFRTFQTKHIELNYIKDFTLREVLSILSRELGVKENEIRVARHLKHLEG